MVVLQQTVNLFPLGKHWGFDSLSAHFLISASGGIGRHKRFKIFRLNSHAGSNPALRILVG